MKPAFLAFLIAFCASPIICGQCPTPAIHTISKNESYKAYPHRHYRLEASVMNADKIEVTLNQKVVTHYFDRANNQLEAFMQLTPGNNIIQVTTSNACGESTSQIQIISLTEPCAQLPVIYRQPNYVSFVEAPQKRIRYQVERASVKNNVEVSFFLNGQPIQAYLSPSQVYDLNLSLNTGKNRLSVSISNDCETLNKEYLLIRCEKPDIHNFTASVNRSEETINVFATVNPQDSIRLTINGVQISHSINGTELKASSRISEGRHEVVISSDNQCQESSARKILSFKRQCDSKPKITIVNKNELTNGNTRVAQVEFENTDNNHVSVMRNDQIYRQMDYPNKHFEYTVFQSGHSTVKTSFFTENACGQKAVASVKIKASGQGGAPKVKTKKDKTPEVSEKCKAKRPYITVYSQPNVKSAIMQPQVLTFNVSALKKIYTEVINESTEKDQYIICTHNGLVLPISIKNDLLEVQVNLSEGKNVIEIIAHNTCKAKTQRKYIQLFYTPCVGSLNMTLIPEKTELETIYMEAQLDKFEVDSKYIRVTQNDSSISFKITQNKVQISAHLEVGLNQFKITYQGEGCEKKTAEASIVREVKCPFPEIKLLTPKVLTYNFVQFNNPILFQVKLSNYALSDTTDDDRKIQVLVDQKEVPYKYTKGADLVTFYVSPRPGSSQTRVFIRVKNDCCEEANIYYTLKNTGKINTPGISIPSPKPRPKKIP